MREFAFGVGGRAEAEAALGGTGDRFHHGWIDMAEDHRSPGLDIVEVAVTIYVIDIGSLRVIDKDRVATYATKGADGAVHAAG